MSTTITKIIDSAEKRIRKAGFNGYSFGDIAQDVGIKTSSIHHYFKTKEILTAEVVRRYAAQSADHFNAELKKGGDPIEIWVTTFRQTIASDDRNCPCTVLGANTLDLPETIKAEVNNFFGWHIDALKTAGLSENGANELLSILVGAQLLATVLNDVSVFDSATHTLLRASRMKNA